MDPDEFLRRLVDRAWSRYKVHVNQSRFEDWITEYLVPRASHLGALDWHRDCTAYRRALEVCRIESRAPVGRRLLAREIRIQQWLSDRQFQDLVIRDDIRGEFARSKRELLREMRSWFPLSGQEPLSEERLKRIVQQMGEASPQILPEGFKYELPELVALLSLLGSGQTDKMQLGNTELSPEESINQIIERWGLAPILNVYFPGFSKFVCAAFAELFGDADESEAAGESVLEAAPQGQYEIARSYLTALPWLITSLPEIAAALLRQPTDSTSALVAPCRKIAAAIQQQQWRFAVFAILLIAVAKSGTAFNERDPFVRDILPSVRKLIAKCQHDPPPVPALNDCNPWRFLVLLNLANSDLSPELRGARFRVARHLWKFGLSDLRRKYRAISKVRRETGSAP